MAKDTPKMQSWQVFHYARKYLGRSALYAIFGKKNARSVDFWCEDPTTTSKDEKAYDPIEGVKNLLKELDDHGHGPVVRSTLKHITSETNITIDGECQYGELLDTLSEEILADFRIVGKLQSAIEERLDPDKVEAIKDQALAEIERTYARYLKERLDEER